MLVLFSACVGFALQEKKNQYWVRKPVRGSQDRRRTPGRHLVQPETGFPLEQMTDVLQGIF